MKKINNEIMQKMISEGKQQKEIALFFGVSGAAICKRIKRLTQSEPPETFKNLSPGEKKFVLAKIEGKSGSAAALQAFNCGSIASAKAIGSRLSGDPDIKRAIHDLMHEEGLGRRKRVQRLRDLVEAKDLGIAAKGLDMSFKLSGEYAPIEVDINAQMTSIVQSIEEIRMLQRVNGIEELTDQELLDI